MTDDELQQLLHRLEKLEARVSSWGIRAPGHYWVRDGDSDGPEADDGWNVDYWNGTAWDGFGDGSSLLHVDERRIRRAPRG